MSSYDGMGSALSSEEIELPTLRLIVRHDIKFLKTLKDFLSKVSAPYESPLYLYFCADSRSNPFLFIYSNSNSVLNLLLSINDLFVTSDPATLEQYLSHKSPIYLNCGIFYDAISSILAFNEDQVNVTASEANTVFDDDYNYESEVSSLYAHKLILTFRYTMIELSLRKNNNVHLDSYVYIYSRKDHETKSEEIMNAAKVIMTIDEPKHSIKTSIVVNNPGSLADCLNYLKPTSTRFMKITATPTSYVLPEQRDFDIDVFETLDPECENPSTYKLRIDNGKYQCFTQENVAGKAHILPAEITFVFNYSSSALIIEMLKKAKVAHIRIMDDDSLYLILEGTVNDDNLDTSMRSLLSLPLVEILEGSNDDIEFQDNLANLL